MTQNQIILVFNWVDLISEHLIIVIQPERIKETNNWRKGHNL